MLLQAFLTLIRKRRYLLYTHIMVTYFKLPNRNPDEGAALVKKPKKTKPSKTICPTAER